MEFWYKISELTSRIQDESVRLVKEIKDEEGLAKLEELSIGDGDSLYLKTLLKKVSINLFGMIEPYTRSLADLETPVEGYEFDADYVVDAETTVTNCIIFRMIAPDTMPATVLYLMENSIESALINYCVSEFLFKSNSDGSVHKAYYEDARSELLGYTNRRVNLRRTYKLY